MLILVLFYRLQVNLKIIIFLVSAFTSAQGCKSSDRPGLAEILAVMARPSPPENPGLTSPAQYTLSRLSLKPWDLQPYLGLTLII